MTKACAYCGVLGYAIAICGFLVAVSHSPLASDLGAQFPFAFVSFALLLAPLWFFAFGAGDWIRQRLEAPIKRIAAASALGIPYLVFAVAAREVRLSMLVVMFGLPVLLAALLQFTLRSQRAEISDALVLGLLIAVYMLHILSPGWPPASLASFPKLFVADIALYLYVVVRPLPSMGYKVQQPGSAALIGLREWLLFFPIAVGLGFGTHFIHFHGHVPNARNLLFAIGVTFLLIALPEELFFRGIIQNLLETRLGRATALITAAILFGLSHFNKGATFNWRYVVLASTAGIFYGRAWRARHQLLASIITHTAVDVVWSIWFK